MNVPALPKLLLVQLDVRDNVYNRSDCIARRALRI